MNGKTPKELTGEGVFSLMTGLNKMYASSLTQQPTQAFEQTTETRTYWTDEEGRKRVTTKRTVSRANP